MGITNEQLAASVEGLTVPRLFAATVRERADAVALRWREGDGWGEWTWAGYADRAARLAASLGDLGVSRGDRVVIMMRNRPEFHVADLAVLLCGATPVSIYNSSAPEQIQYLAHHCGAVAAVLEDVEFLERVRKVRGDLPDLREIAVVEDPDGRAPSDVRRWDALLAADPVDLDEAVTIVAPDDLATVIYTSGTTGPPKGVMLDHANVCWTAESLFLALGRDDLPGRRVVSYLPMAHIAERMASHYLAMRVGFEVTTCPETNQLPTYLGWVRPEVFFGVPRVYEKIHAGVHAAVAGNEEQGRAIEHAIEVGLAVKRAELDGRPAPSDLLAEHEQLEELLRRPVRELLGLDQLITAISAAAPITVELLEYFLGLGLPVSELYGLSESSGPMTWDPVEIRPGMVGRAIPGCEVRLGEDGEVLCRGGNVFRGYLDDPEKTAETLDPEGWLHTGDIGVMDGDGYLDIVDRKKELIITAGGKNIAPANVEAALKACDFIGQACVIGDGRPYIGALVVLDGEFVRTWAQRHGIESDSLAELARHPEVMAEVEACVQTANERFSQVERVKRYVVLSEEWPPDSDELTPTMKLKRRGIHAKYAAEIESLYA
ncbi:MAG: AMP-dependent synthetase/ligase [Acidimicrobiia bacterium]|nr:AMP-dependent synthetase/ligase [Acidimicrobiia bacterium]